MSKEYVDPVVFNKFQYDPPDADYTWVAKVMLLACPNREDFIAKTCQLAGNVRVTPLFLTRSFVVFLNLTVNFPSVQLCHRGINGLLSCILDPDPYHYV
jgi:hypothetical protein